MNKIILFAVLISSLLISCGGGEAEKSNEKSTEKKKQEQQDNGDTLVGGDTLLIIPDYQNPYPKFISKKEKGILKFFFNDSLTAEIFALHNVFDSIKTEKQMLDYYGAMKALKSKLHFHLSDLNSEPNFTEKVENIQASKVKDESFDDYRVVIDYMREELKQVDKYLHGMKFTCVAECTEPYYDLILNDLVKVAEKTEGESDEKFMKLIIEYYSGEGEPDAMSAVWFQATWDYGGSSKLGDGKHFSFLKTCDVLIEEKSIFSEEINYYREDCFSDMTRWKSFMNGKEKILKEVKQVMKEIKLSESQMDELKSRKKELDEFQQNDPTGYGLQLNCENGDCAYG